MIVVTTIHPATARAARSAWISSVMSCSAGSPKIRSTIALSIQKPAM